MVRRLLNFNSKEVQLKEILENSMTVCIRYFNSKEVQLKDLLTLYEPTTRYYFNSKEVQLKVARRLRVYQCFLLFQFQRGAIKRV